MGPRDRLVKSVRDLREQDVSALLRLALELQKRKPGEQLAFVIVPEKGRTGFKMASARFADATGDNEAIVALSKADLGLIRDVLRGTDFQPHAVHRRADQDLAVLVSRNEDRVLAHRGSLLADALSTGEVATALQLTRQAVVARVNRHDLLAIRNGQKYCFPRWQFVDSESSGVLAGLPDVLRAAAHLSDIEIASWLSRAQLVFGGKVPADLIRSGEIDRVVQAISGVGVT
jgi:hypothetical protein